MPKQSRLKATVKGVNKNTPSLGDLKKLEEEVAGYFDTSGASINILIFVDEEASAELASEVRNLFSSNASFVKLQISYFDNTVPQIDSNADMAVVVAGNSALSNDLAKACREAGVPAYLISAKDAKFVPEHTFYNGDYCQVDSTSADSIRAMTRALSQWIAAVCKAQKFAFAKAFPFVAEPIAMEAVHLTSIENAAIGFVPFLKGADFPLMFLNQLKMLGEIAAVYDVELDMKLLKEAAGVLVVAIFGKKCFKFINKIVPLPACIIGAPVSFLTTEAIGRALIEYFEAGGNLSGVAKVIQKGIETSGVAGKALKPVVDAVSPVVSKVAGGLAK